MISLATIKARYSVSEYPLRAERKVELALLILGCLLVFQLVYGALEITRSREVEPIAPALDALAPVGSRLPEVPGLAQSAEIEARPLFWKERRPVGELELSLEKSDGPDNAPTAVRKFKGVELVGIFSEGEKGGVILLQGDKKLRLVIGEDIKGWELVAVDTMGAEFRNGANVEKLTLLKRDQSQVVVEQAGDAAAKQKPDTKDADARKAGKGKVEDTLTFGGA